MDRRSSWRVGGHGAFPTPLTGPFSARPATAPAGQQFFVTPTLTATCASGQTQPIVTTYTGSVWAAAPTVIFRNSAVVQVTGTTNQRSLLRAGVAATGTRANAVLAPSLLNNGITASKGSAIQIYVNAVLAASAAGTTHTWRLKYSTATILSAISAPGVAGGGGDILFTITPRGGNTQRAYYRQVRSGGTVSEAQAAVGLVTPTVSQTLDLTVQPGGVGSTVTVYYLSVMWIP